MENNVLERFFSESSFVTSDHHFAHKNMLKYEPIRAKLENSERKSIEVLMMERWNEVVPYDAYVLHLGDFAWHTPVEWGLALGGNKILLQGNHDRFTRKKYLEAGFLEYFTDPIIYIDGKYEQKKKIPKNGGTFLITDVGKHRIIFSHLPMILLSEFDKKFEEKARILQEFFDEYSCDVNIHGHIHSKKSDERYCRNVSVELHDFKPVLLSEILASLK